MTHSRRFSVRNARWWAAPVGAVAAASMLLTGCTAGGGNGSSGGSDNGSGKGLTLTVQDYYSTPTSTQFEKIYQECAESIGAKVKISHIAGAGYMAKVLQQVSSHTMPDVMMLDNPDVVTIAETGALSELADYDITGKGYIKGILDAGSYKGKLYGLAPAVNSLALFYNVDMLKAAGVEPPQTWDELQAAAKKLTAPGQYGFAFSGVNTYEGTWQFMPWMWSNGGDEKNINTPQVAGALQFLRGMIEDGSMSDSVVLWGQGDVNSQFMAGKTAMMENGPWNIPQLQQEAKNINWAIVPLPVPKAGDDVVAPLGGETFTVPQTGNKDKMAAAGKMVACLNNDENQVKISETVNYVPSKTSVAEKFAETHPQLAPFVKVVQTARSRTGELGTDWPKTATALYTAMQLVLTGKATPEQALAQASQG